jgi:hypothetical protein
VRQGGVAARASAAFGMVSAFRGVGQAEVPGRRWSPQGDPGPRLEGRGHKPIRGEDLLLVRQGGVAARASAAFGMGVVLFAASVGLKDSREIVSSGRSGPAPLWPRPRCYLLICSSEADEQSFCTADVAW